MSVHRSEHAPDLIENLLAVAHEVTSAPRWVQTLAIIAWFVVPCWRAVDDSIHPVVDFGLLSAISLPAQVLLIAHLALFLSRGKSRARTAPVRTP